MSADNKSVRGDQERLLNAVLFDGADEFVNLRVGPGDLVVHVVILRRRDHGADRTNLYVVIHKSNVV